MKRNQPVRRRIDLRLAILVSGLLACAALPALAGAGDPAANDLAANDAQEAPEVVRLQSDFQSIAERVSPSVVAISASFAPVDDDSTLRREEMNADKLEIELDRATRTVGTGMIISGDGYVLTNEHVVCDGQQLWVTTDDRQVFPAIVVGSDPRADLAVLKIPASGLHPVKFARMAVHRGQWTVAIGNPFGLAEGGNMAMSVGVVSATERSLPRLTSHENRLYSNLIQTTAQINPGSSGGPLFDLDGEVIGINTAVIMPQKQTNGIGFALPVTDTLLKQVNQLRDGHEIVYGYLGVMVSTPSARERTLAGVPHDRGVSVNAVDPAERAASALKAGDIVYAVNEVPVGSSDQFIRLVGESAVEQRMTLALSRDGSLMTATVIPRKRNVPSIAVCRDAQRLRWRGMLIGPVPVRGVAGDAAVCSSSATPAARGGVMVYDIDCDSPAVKLGITPGSIITAIAGHSVHDVVELQKLINDTPTDACQITAFPQQNAVAMTEH